MSNVDTLIPGKYYHIYNRGNNRQKVFLCDADYKSFLLRWKKYINPVAKTFAYCLLPNHFHAIIQICWPEQISGHTEEEKLLAINRQFTNFFIAYSRTLQKRHDFHGAVFHSPYKRRNISSDHDFTGLIGYVHLNPVKHGICKDYAGYRNSSYLSILSDSPTSLQRDYLLNWFGGKNKFVEFHEQQLPFFEINDHLE